MHFYSIRGYLASGQIVDEAEVPGEVAAEVVVVVAVAAGVAVETMVLH